MNEVIREVESGWGNCIMMHVVGPKPHFRTLEAYAKCNWKIKENFSIQSSENGFSVIRFNNIEDCNKILEEGPWFF